jgi:hypothetical protein
VEKAVSVDLPALSPPLRQSESIARLRAPRSRAVNIEATDDGAGLLLGSRADSTYVQALARGVSRSLKLSDKIGRVQVIRP